MKKIKITKKNICAVNGLINKFFRSIEKKKHYLGDVDLIKWNKPQHGVYISSIGKNNISKVDGKPVAIHIEEPVRANIKIGDYVVLDGNRFMYRHSNCKWGRIYFRKLPSYDYSVKE